MHKLTYDDQYLGSGHIWYYRFGDMDPWTGPINLGSAATLNTSLTEIYISVRDGQNQEKERAYLEIKGLSNGAYDVWLEHLKKGQTPMWPPGPGIPVSGFRYDDHTRPPANRFRYKVDTGPWSAFYPMDAQGSVLADVGSLYYNTIYLPTSGMERHRRGLLKIEDAAGGKKDVTIRSDPSFP